MKYNKNEIIGKMRDRITIQNVTRTRSDTGYASESWADSAIVWANAESKLPSSNETVIDGKYTAKNISDFTIRYTTGIDEESRIIWNDKLYQVRNIKVSHDRRYISFQGEFYDSYIVTGVSVAAILTANASLSSNVKVIHNVLAAMNAIATTNAEIVVSQQGQVLVDASLSASGNVSADVTKMIQINSDVTANGTLAAAVTKVIYIDSTLNANATLVGDALVSKTLISTLTASGTTESELTVTTQGVTTVDASLTALGTLAAELLRVVTLESSPTTSATTELNASLTKVIEANVTATATTENAAQLTIAVNAQTNATATTTADASLSYTVNAETTATATTTIDAQITRTIEASANATATTSVEAGVGVTFVASNTASASVTNAELFRTATLAANVSAAATVTNSNLQLFDPYFADVSLLLHGNGTNGSTTFTDSSTNNLSSPTRNGDVQINTSIVKFGTGSIKFDGNGDYLNYGNQSVIDLLSGDFTIEFWIYKNTSVTYMTVCGDFRVGSTNTYQILFDINGTKIAWFNGATTSFTLTATNTISNTTWTHIAFVRSGTTLTVYLNGQANGNSTLNTNYNSTENYFIGHTPELLAGRYLDAYLDDFRITVGTARYTANFTPPTREFLDQ